MKFERSCWFSKYWGELLNVYTNSSLKKINFTFSQDSGYSVKKLLMVITASLIVFQVSKIPKLQMPNNVLGDFQWKGKALLSLHVTALTCLVSEAIPSSSMFRIPSFFLTADHVLYRVQYLGTLMLLHPSIPSKIGCKRNPWNSKEILGTVCMTICFLSASNHQIISLFKGQRKKKKA